MASQPNQIKPELVEIAERIGLSIRQLRSSLATAVPKVEASKTIADGEPQPPETPHETQEDLERQLSECFDKARDVQPSGSSLSGSQEAIYDRVIDGIVDQILHDWDRLRLGTPGAIEDQVVERLIARILERLEP